MSYKAANEIPVGTHYSKVLAFLDSNKITHSSYHEAKLYDPKIGDYVKVRTIGGQIPVVRKTLFAQWSINMDLLFDESGSLTDYRIQEMRDE